MVCTGDIKEKKYEILGVVGALVDDQESAETTGCMGSAETVVSVDANAVYSKGAQALVEKAQVKGGDAVIYASFDYRMAVKKSGQSVSQVKELFCYGTAVKFVG